MPDGAVRGSRFESKITVCVLVWGLLQGAIAQADEDIDKAIQEVQRQLQDPAFIEAEAKKSPDAAKSHKMVSELAGGSDQEKEIYALASEVLGNFKGMSLEEMKLELLKAQKDPGQFAKKWTPEQRKRLQSISSKLPGSTPPKKP